MNFFLKTAVIIAFILSSGGLEGQLNYKNGYIISLENDTLIGLINDGGGNRNSKLCLFKENKKSEATRYYPGDIKSFRFTGDKYYSSKEVLRNSEYRKVFTDVLLEGKVNLYHYWKNNEMSFYLERDTGNLIGLLNQRALIPIAYDSLYELSNSKSTTHPFSVKYSDRSNTRVNIEFYKDTLYSVFSDSEKVKNLVDSVKYTQKSLINITKAYINETCTGNDCIIYEKNLKLSRPSFGVLTGIQLSNIKFWESTIRTDTLTTAFESSVQSDIVPSILAGIFCNIPVPRINDRLSFQIELTTNTIVYNQGSIRLPGYNSMKVKSGTLSVPLLLKYKIPGNIISPSIAVGKETGFVVKSEIFDPESIDPEDPNDGLLKQVLHKNQRGGWFCEAGMNYNLGSKITLFSNVRLQSNHNLIVSKSHEDNSAYQLTFSDVLEYKFYEHRFKSNIAALHIGIVF
ncbi:MAG: hypothetical protein WD512_17570 [Candidatus Paceibacterota bacterium]